MDSFLHGTAIEGEVGQQQEKNKATEEEDSIQEDVQTVGGASNICEGVPPSQPSSRKLSLTFGQSFRM